MLGGARNPGPRRALRGPIEKQLLRFGRSVKAGSRGPGRRGCKPQTYAAHLAGRQRLPTRFSVL